MKCIASASAFAFAFAPRCRFGGDHVLCTEHTFPCHAMIPYHSFLLTFVHLFAGDFSIHIVIGPGFRSRFNRIHPLLCFSFLFLFWGHFLSFSGFLRSPPLHSPPLSSSRNIGARQTLISVFQILPNSWNSRKRPP
jgi:hypothetical protein